MNLLKAQRNKRARRQAIHEAHLINKTTPSSDPANVTIYATRVGNAYRRKWMSKRGFLRSDIGITLKKAIAKLPTSWTRSCRIVLLPGVYGGR